MNTQGTLVERNFRERALGQRCARHASGGIQGKGHCTGAGHRSPGSRTAARKSYGHTSRRHSLRYC